MYCADMFQKKLTKFEENLLSSKDLFLFSSDVYILCSLHIMASPGQKRSSCRHVMAGFDGRDKCARCSDKDIEVDPCVLK